MNLLLPICYCRVKNIGFGWQQVEDFRLPADRNTNKRKVMAVGGPEATVL